MKRGFVFSDLHMFSHSSLYESLLPEIYSHCAAADTIVLNGDLFDFKRSRFTTHEETAKHALEWCYSFFSRFNDKKIYYMIGNHDSVDLFVVGLKETAAQFKNVSILEDLLELGPNIFLHGDVCDAVTPSTDLRVLRKRYREISRSRISIIMAEIITRLRFNKVEYFRHSNTHLADRILTYIDLARPGWTDSARHIFFGHTHVPFRNFHYKGHLFTNTGSAVRGLAFEPAEFSYPEKSTGRAPQNP